MGYASYTLPDGREAGYAVKATCDENGCTTSIDRGLAYLCGQTPGGDEWGCGNYFCGAHLFYSGVDNLKDVKDVPWMCRQCTDAAVKSAGNAEVAR